MQSIVEAQDRAPCKKRHTNVAGIAALNGHEKRFPDTRGTFLEVSIISNAILWGLYWGTPR